MMSFIIFEFTQRLVSNIKVLKVLRVKASLVVARASSSFD